MCGIAGTINWGDREVLTAMTSCLNHRGPDDSGLAWFDDAGSGLGHRRLSIIDLSSTGHQPMSDEKQEHWIAYNGELFNYRELRDELASRGVRFRTQSDTEVVLAAYKLWGRECLQRFNGMFAFGIFDSTRKRLFAARDRLGIKPFYYAQSGASLVFASEIKAILASHLVPASPDYTALLTPSRFQVAPLTGFEGIRKLLPGHTLEFDGGRLDIQPYWTISPREDPLREEEAVARLDELLADSVRLQMVADVPVGIFLSGGLDSSIICALMTKRTSEPVHSFTIKFRSQDQRFERMADDAAFASQLARDFGLVHHEFEIEPDVADMLQKLVWHLDEPLADPAAINTFLMARAARDHGIIVLLNGMGGDEVFGGYRKHLACLTADHYQRLVPGFLQGWVEGVVDRLPVASSRRGFRMVRWGKRFLSFASLPRAERFLMADLSLGKRQFEECFTRAVTYE